MNDCRCQYEITHIILATYHTASYTCVGYLNAATGLVHLPLGALWVFPDSHMRQTIITVNLLCFQYGHHWRQNPTREYGFNNINFEHILKLYIKYEKEFSRKSDGIIIFSCKCHYLLIDHNYHNKILGQF